MKDTRKTVQLHTQLRFNFFQMLFFVGVSPQFCHGRKPLLLQGLKTRDNQLFKVKTGRNFNQVARVKTIWETG